MFLCFGTSSNHLLSANVMSSLQSQTKKMSTTVLAIFVPCVFSLFYFYTMSQETSERSTCIFCNIANRLENTEILYEDEDVCVFRDIKPASRFHILTIPKRHIEDATSLTPSDKSLVEKMLTIAKEQIVKENLTVSDTRFGYHWPPFRSVHHLHLHAIAPESEMGYIARLVFMKNSYWFVSPEYVDSMLTPSISS